MGRALAFDREQVLSQVTELFWLKGYQATSVADLVQETRLKPGSIYNTFNSKHDLLMESLERYSRWRVDMFRALMDQHRPLLELVRQLLQELVDECCDDPDARGCLLLKIQLEQGGSDAKVKARIDQSYALIEQVFSDAIVRAQKCDELKEDVDAAGLAKYLLMSCLGLQVMSCNRSGRAAMEAMTVSMMAAFEQAAVVPVKAEPV
ncbi:MAG: TetR/AcrR family transcriptional regulator [Motiliproteus sp.]